jgi:hypothetical protein
MRGVVAVYPKKSTAKNKASAVRIRPTNCTTEPVNFVVRRFLILPPHIYNQTLSKKTHELANHFGNVLVTTSNSK